MFFSDARRRAPLFASPRPPVPTFR